jgi:hypothetical protein
MSQFTPGALQGLRQPRKDNKRQVPASQGLNIGEQTPGQNVSDLSPRAQRLQQSANQKRQYRPAIADIGRQIKDLVDSGGDAGEISKLRTRRANLLSGMRAGTSLTQTRKELGVQEASRLANVQSGLESDRFEGNTVHNIAQQKGLSDQQAGIVAQQAQDLEEQKKMFGGKLEKQDIDNLIAREEQRLKGADADLKEGAADLVAQYDPETTLAPGYESRDDGSRDRERKNMESDRKYELDVKKFSVTQQQSEMKGLETQAKIIQDAIDAQTSDYFRTEGADPSLQKNLDGIRRRMNILNNIMNTPPGEGDVEGGGGDLTSTAAPGTEQTSPPLQGGSGLQQPKPKITPEGQAGMDQSQAFQDVALNDPKLIMMAKQGDPQAREEVKRRVRDATQKLELNPYSRNEMTGFSGSRAPQKSLSLGSVPIG